MRKINLDTAKKFVTRLYGTPDAKVTFQTFYDSQSGEPPPENNLSRILHGPLKDLHEELDYLQSRGCGIFLMPNRGDFGGRSNKNVVAISAYFVDDDENRHFDFPLPPSAIIKSRNGIHAYWFALPGQSLKTFSSTQKALIHRFGTDKSVNELCRVLRLPGSWHLKDPQKPFLVEILELNDNRYNEDQILEMCQSEQSRPTPGTETKKNVEQVSHMKQLQLYFIERGIQRSVYSINFLKLLELAKIPFTKSDSKIHIICPNYANHSNDGALNSSTSILFPIHGVNYAMLKCFHSHCQHVTLVDLLKSISKECIEESSEKDFKVSATQAAELFRLTYENTLRFHKRDWYGWVKTYYKVQDRVWFEAHLTQFLQTLPHGKNLTSFLREVLTHVTGMSVIPFEEAPFWIEKQDRELLIAMKSGLFSIDGFLKGEKKPIRSHTPLYFNLNALNFDYNENGKCPTFLKFLEEMIPDPELRRGLQEFIGLCFTPDTSFNVMMFLKGDGANGKSVLLEVIRCLLGKENVSSLGLEAFNLARTFPLASSANKLANIASEVSEVGKAEEGVLKQYTGGEPLSVERKQKDPFPMYPTAKLIFAMNTLPVFRDKTDGIFRRIFLIPMDVTIPREKQNRNLIKSDFWENSGELEGIFNWGLEGLKRLRERGHFEMPQASETAKGSYRAEMNPARNFLLEAVEIGTESDKISSPTLFQLYKMWCAENGNSPLNSNNFCKEIKRLFPDAIYNQNPETLPNKQRVRVWKKLKFINSGPTPAERGF